MAKKRYMVVFSNAECLKSLNNCKGVINMVKYISKADLFAKTNYFFRRYIE